MIDAILKDTEFTAVTQRTAEIIKVISWLSVILRVLSVTNPPWVAVVKRVYKTSWV